MNELLEFLDEGFQVFDEVVRHPLLEHLELHLEGLDVIADFSDPFQLTVCIHRRGELVHFLTQSKELLPQLWNPCQVFLGYPHHFHGGGQGFRAVFGNPHLVGQAFELHIRSRHALDGVHSSLADGRKSGNGGSSHGQAFYFLQGTHELVHGSHGRIE